MIEKFAGALCIVASKFLDLNHTCSVKFLVSLVISSFARDTSIDDRRTTKLRHEWRDSSGG